jgi:hypothetical protein
MSTSAQPEPEPAHRTGHGFMVEPFSSERDATLWLNSLLNAYSTVTVVGMAWHGQDRLTLAVEVWRSE